MINKGASKTRFVTITDPKSDVCARLGANCGIRAQMVTNLVFYSPTKQPHYNENLESRFYLRTAVIELQTMTQKIAWWSI